MASPSEALAKFSKCTGGPARRRTASSPCGRPEPPFISDKRKLRPRGLLGLSSCPACRPEPCSVDRVSPLPPLQHVLCSWKMGGGAEPPLRVCLCLALRALSRLPGTCSCTGLWVLYRPNGLLGLHVPALNPALSSALTCPNRDSLVHVPRPTQLCRGHIPDLEAEPSFKGSESARSSQHRQHSPLILAADPGPTDSSPTAPVPLSHSKTACFRCSLGGSLGHFFKYKMFPKNIEQQHCPVELPR